MKTLKFTINQLKDYLSKVDKLTFVSMETITPKRMNDYLDYWIEVDGEKKKNPNLTPNPFLPEGIYSHSRLYRIITGFNYKDSVERRRKRKGLPPTFQNQTDKKIWYRHISNTLVQNVYDESKYYFKYLRCRRSMLEHEYLYKGNPIEKHLFESYLVTSNTRYGNQGLGEDSVPIEVVSLSNIRTLSINGLKIEVIQPKVKVKVTKTKKNKVTI